MLAELIIISVDLTSVVHTDSMCVAVRHPQVRDEFLGIIKIQVQGSDTNQSPTCSEEEQALYGKASYFDTTVFKLGQLSPGDKDLDCAEKARIAISAHKDRSQHSRGTVEVRLRVLWETRVPRVKSIE